VYLSIGGLDKICRPIKLSAWAEDLPLRFSGGPVVVYNQQGFLIDAFTPQSADRFLINRGRGGRSDRLDYFRHSFAQYCQNHRPGGAKEVDPADTNWHRDGTPHVDYSTLTFAIVGQVNGSLRSPGRTSADLSLMTQLGSGAEPWAIEQPEEDGELETPDDGDGDDDGGGDDDDD
jgi:hypothetical protein